MKWASSILLGVVMLSALGSAPRRAGSGARALTVSANDDARQEPRAARPAAWSERTDNAGAALRPREGERAANAQDALAPTRFAFVDAYVDSKGQSLAAYQFELTATGAGVTLVGVEGGDHPAYAGPPYYDPKANLQNRIVIAAFNAGDDLPRGRTRVARVMVRITGAAAAPAWSAKLDVAASTDAKPIDATVQVSEGAAP